MLYGNTSWSRCVALLLLLAALAISGCTQKAQALKVGVSQFRAESLAAIDAIDAMRRQELAPAPRSNAEASAEFVDNIINADELNEQLVEISLDPYTVAPASAVEQAWYKFLAKMRTQYTAFANIFSEVNRASFTGREAIAKAGPLVAKLTAQLAAFASVIDENPPRLHQHRTALLARLDAIKQGGGDEISIRREISLWRDQWLSVIEAEQQLGRDTVAQCLKAAAVGVEVRKQIQAYDDVTIEDITTALDVVFNIAASITGDNYDALRSRTNTIFAEIEIDPTWRDTASIALGEVNAALGAGGDR